jgi:hypothetical protein
MRHAERAILMTMSATMTDQAVRYSARCRRFVLGCVLALSVSVVALMGGGLPAQGSEPAQGEDASVAHLDFCEVSFVSCRNPEIVHASGMASLSIASEDRGADRRSKKKRASSFVAIRGPMARFCA